MCKSKPNQEKFYMLYITHNLSQKDIAEKYNVSVATIKKWCREFGFRKSNDLKEELRKKTTQQKYGVFYNSQTTSARIKQSQNWKNRTKEEVSIIVEKRKYTRSQNPNSFKKQQTKKPKKRRTKEEQNKHLKNARNVIYQKYGMWYVETDKFKKQMQKRPHYMKNHIHKTALKIITNKTLLKRAINKCGSREILAQKLNVSYSYITREMSRFGLAMNNTTYMKSKHENEMVLFLKELGIQNIIQNDRKTIYPKELDISLLDYKIAIEINGLYWHSESKKGKKQHINKYQLCKQKDITLIQFFEDEWLHKNKIVKSIIASKLGKIQNRIYARQCDIVSINTAEKDQFLINNHLQGTCRSAINLGLKYKNEIVALMTFGSRKITAKTTFELLRFCNKINTIVIGSVSKLLSHFLKNNKQQITTYVDLRYGNRTMYEKLGFSFEKQSSPNYWYFKNQNQRHHRWMFRKQELNKKLEHFDPNLTEYQNMLNNGYDRIWDCGNDVLIMEV